MIREKFVERQRKVIYDGLFNDVDGVFEKADKNKDGQVGKNQNESKPKSENESNPKTRK